MAYKVVMVLCRKCGHKWVAVVPAEVPVNQLQCSACQEQDAILFDPDGEKH